MRVPGVAGFRLDMRETGARGRIRNADEMVARRALNLPAGIARVATQRLITMGTIEFEFVGAHSLHPIMRKPGSKSIWYIYSYFWGAEYACSLE